MSSVGQFHLFHGLVLAKILRSDRPTSLRLIETNTRNEWSTYVVNDAQLLVKYRLVTTRMTDSEVVWNFVFSQKELQQIREKDYYAVLVCGLPEIEKEALEKMQACFLRPDQIKKFLESSQNINVKHEPGTSKWLLVSSKRGKIQEKIPRNALTEWEVPGS